MRWIDFSAHTNNDMYVFLKVKKGHFFGGDYMNLENIFSFENLYDAHKNTCIELKTFRFKIL